jgi:HlyD family secretion protein
MTSQVSIVTSTLARTVAVPIQAVVERVPGKKVDEEVEEDAPKQKYVFMVRDGTARMVQVQTGISDARDVAIVSGVKAGDPVVTGPFRLLKKLEDGTAVEVVKEPAVPKQEN